MDAAGTAPDGMTNKHLSAWVERDDPAVQAGARAHGVDGSEREYERLCAMMVEVGTFIRLNPDKRPDSFSRSLASVGRGPRRGAGPYFARCRMPGRPTTGAPPGEDARHAAGLFDGCMRGRTMYVIPFSIGAARLADRQDRRADRR